MTWLPPLPDDPDRALAEGRWVKWIGGASNQDLAAIEDLAGIHALAGVHCLDVAADAAVVAAARRGIAWAEERHRDAGGSAADWSAPWLMVSLSDGADPHFRKARFDPQRCPIDCPRPCARSCPALAIPMTAGSGVLAERCYGCGRCLPACPLGLIEEQQRILSPEQVPPLLQELKPDAIELHTRLGRQRAFADRLDQVRAADLPLRRLAVSCGLEPASGEQPSPTPVTPGQLARELWQRQGLLQAAGMRPLWQLDGRPMRGDLGSGTAHAAVRLWQRLAPLAPPGPLQLAGGTNQHTHTLVQRIPAEQRPPLAGVAFGGVSRSLLQPLLLEAQGRGMRLLDATDLWPQALTLARGLVAPWLAGAGCRR